VRNYLALLGWGTEDDTTLMSTEELIERFSIERVGRSSAIFDERKLRWMNGRFMRELPLDEYTDAVASHLKAAGVEVGRDELRAACAIAQDKAQTLAEVWPLIRFLFEPPVDDEKARAKFLKPEHLENLRGVRAVLAETDPFDAATLEERLTAFVEERGLKPKEVYQPLRVAITGTTVSPGIFDSVAALGRERTLERVDAALD